MSLAKGFASAHKQTSERILTTIVNNKTDHHGDHSISLSDLHIAVCVKPEFLVEYCEELVQQKLIKLELDGDPPQEWKDVNRCTVKATEGGVAVYNYAIKN